MPAADAAEVKSAFNIKVLKRHDSSIDSIVHSASFVVLYLYDPNKAAWSKTGIEGPMFLYHRSQAPHYGMFLLNRNGVDNFSVPLTKDDDLELTEEFVILRTEDASSLGEEEDEDQDDEKIIGVWVFEKDQRQIVGNEMLRLQSLAAQEDHVPAVSTSNSSFSLSSQPQPTSISLDALFSSASQQPSPKPATSQSQPQHSSQSPPPSSRSGPALLDAIFQSASISSPKPSPRTENATAPSPHPAAAAAAPVQDPSSSDPAAGLMALLGLRSPAPAEIPQQRMVEQQQHQTQTKSRPSPPPMDSKEEEKPQTESQSQGSGGMPALLASFFHSATPANHTALGGDPSQEQAASNGAKQVSPTVPKGPKRATTPTGPKANQGRGLQVRRDPPLTTTTTATTNSAPTSSATPPSVSTPSAIPDQSPSLREIGVGLINGQMAKRESTTKEAPLSKTDFMRELLGLIHTDKTFTTELYEAYLERQKT